MTQVSFDVAFLWTQNEFLFESRARLCHSVKSRSEYGFGLGMPSKRHLDAQLKLCSVRSLYPLQKVKYIILHFLKL
jgi:hypothetical protein